MNEQVVNKGAGFFPTSLLHAHEEGWGSGYAPNEGWGSGYAPNEGMGGKLAQTAAWLSMTRSIRGGGAFGREPAPEEKKVSSCARPAGKKRRAHSLAARRCSSAVVGVASVSLGTGAQGGAMPHADGSELRLHAMTANTVGCLGGKQCRGDRTAQLGVGWSSDGRQWPARLFGQDGSSNHCC
jgi:hypothetical protein